MTRTEAGIVATRLMGCVNDQPFVDAVGKTKEAGHLVVSSVTRDIDGKLWLRCTYDPEAPWNHVPAGDGNRYPVTDSNGQPLYPSATFPPESADVRYVIVDRGKSGGPAADDGHVPNPLHEALSGSPPVDIQVTYSEAARLSGHESPEQRVTRMHAAIDDCAAGKITIDQCREIIGFQPWPEEADTPAVVEGKP